MDRENKLNTAGAIWLAQLAVPMSETTRLILAVALGAIVGRIVWTWIKPDWAKYPATVAALMVLALIMKPH